MGSTAPVSGAKASEATGNSGSTVGNAGFAEALKPSSIGAPAPIPSVPAPSVAQVMASTPKPSSAPPPPASVMSARTPPAAPPTPGSNKDLAAKIASLERQIRDANSEARKAPLIAQLTALRSAGSAPAAGIRPSAAEQAKAAAAEPKISFRPSPASTLIGDKELASKIAALERQIRDANSEARKAPLMAMLNKLRSGASPSTQTAAAEMLNASSKSSVSAMTSAPFNPDKELAAKIASLERQIKDANSEARRAPLTAMLNALKSQGTLPVSAAKAKRGSNTLSASTVSPTPATPTPLIVDKETVAKIASLERQIKDANSEARKAPLIAQLNALRYGSSASAGSTHADNVSKIAAKYPEMFVKA